MFVSFPLIFPLWLGYSLVSPPQRHLRYSHIPRFTQASVKLFYNRVVCSLPPSPYLPTRFKFKFFFLNLLVAGQNDVRKGMFGSLGWTCTALFKMDNQQGPTGTLLNIMWQPGWEGSLGENGHVYVYVWLSPFTVHLKSSQHHLLNGYTPVQNKEFWKNEIKFRDTGAHD